MQLIVLSDEISKEALLSRGWDPSLGLVWISEPSQFSVYNNADAFLDLSFTPSEEWIKLLSALLPKPVIINSVTHTLSGTNPLFIRINGWPTFLNSPIMEASASVEQQSFAAKIFSLLNRETTWLPDDPGFVRARVVCAIIHEAFLALKEGVSTKEEIDTAMRLGTNYPYGPFQWFEILGPERVREYLELKIP